ncbi:unnamed protein product, partial [marine sediment metagenome]
LIAGIIYEDAEKKARQLLNDVGLSERFTHKPGELSGAGTGNSFDKGSKGSRVQRVEGQSSE